MTDPLAKIEWPVRTERLVLRRPTGADIDAMWRIRSQPAVYEWVTSAEVSLAEFRARHALPEVAGTIVVIDLDGVVIGDLMIRVGTAWAQKEVRHLAADTEAELGWTVDPAYQGKGYATEAVHAAIGLCFGPLGLRRVIASAFADNTASWRLMERLGMRKEQHTVKESLHRTRGWLDGVTYALLAEEWSG